MVEIYSWVSKESLPVYNKYNLLNSCAAEITAVITASYVNVFLSIA